MKFLKIKNILLLVGLIISFFLFITVNYTYKEKYKYILNENARLNNDIIYMSFVIDDYMNRYEKEMYDSLKTEIKLHKDLDLHKSKKKYILSEIYFITNKYSNKSYKIQE